jgi:RNA 3'-terminal phosphate cyclase
MGLIKRVRGLVFCARISPTIIARVVDSARGVLNNLLPDVYIHADHYKGAEGGKSPGYSLSLVAESTTGVLLSVERTAGEGDASSSGSSSSSSGNSSSNSSSSSSSSSRSSSRPELPETVGEEGAYRLLEEIRKGGIIDSAHQPLVLMLMVVTPEDVSKVRFGELTDQAVRTLRLLREAFGVTFKIKEDPAEAAAAAAESMTAGRPKLSTKKRRASRRDEDEEEEEEEDNDRAAGRARNGTQHDGQASATSTIGRTLFLSCLGTGYINMSRKIR